MIAASDATSAETNPLSRLRRNMRRIGIMAFFLALVALVPPVHGQADAEVRQLWRVVAQEGRAAEVRGLQLNIAVDRRDTARRIRGLRNNLEGARRTRNTQAAQMWERLIADEENQLQARIQGRIDNAPSSVRRFYVAARRIASAGFLAVVSFYTSEMIGSVETLGDPRTKAGSMYRAALRGDCGWLRDRVNSEEWARQVELELLGRNVRNAPAIVERLFASLKDVCRSQ